jgi:voltage-gated potassium channel
LLSIGKKYQRLKQQLIFSLILLIGLFLAGTFWYRFVEGWTILDSAYMTIITLSTVGFGETHPLSAKSRIFTAALILTGLFTIGYIVNLFTEAVIQGYFQERMILNQQKKLIASLSQHYIVCGFGRTGRQVAVEFQAEGIPFVLLDTDLERLEKAKQLGFTTLQGDATLDEALLAAKIDQAVCLVTALRSDADNLYTILSAKTLNPQIRAIARASTEEAVQKMQRAGADAVISPYITGGRRLAAAALRPQVMDFVDGILAGSETAYYLEEFKIDAENCPFVGQTLSEAKLRSHSGALVLAIRRREGHFIAGPMGDTQLLPEDSLICMGTAEQLRILNKILGPINQNNPRLPKQK